MELLVAGAEAIPIVSVSPAGHPRTPRQRLDQACIEASRKDGCQTIALLKICARIPTLERYVLRVADVGDVKREIFVANPTTHKLGIV